MGFFGIVAKTKTKGGGESTAALLHKHECSMCPFNAGHGLQSPKMEPTGSAHPLIYIIGEAPGKKEDERGEQFVGPAGRLLRGHLGDGLERKIRWNNVIRCRPPENRTPEFTETEACRPSIERDIEQSQPRAIFGFGNTPLNWLTGQNGITKWRGKYMPVRIGEHTCWFFPMLHPSYVLRSRNQYEQAESEFVFALDLQRAVQLAQSLPDPIVHEVAGISDDVEIIDGSGGMDDVHMIENFLEAVSDKQLIGIDYETNCERPYLQKAKLLTFAVASRDRTLAFAIDHKQALWNPLQLERVKDAMRRFFASAGCRKVSHNLAFELEWTGYFFGNLSIRRSQWGCSQSQAYILDERQGGHGLDDLCLQHFGIHLKAISNLDRKRLDDSPVEEVLRYNGLDAKYHRLLYLHQAQILSEEGLNEVYENHLRRLPAIALTQLRGVPIDARAVKRYHAQYQRAIDKIEARIAETDAAKKFRRVQGRDFRVSANKDVAAMLSMLGVKDIDSVDKMVLSQIKHHIVKLILLYRKYAKVQSTYIEPVMPDSPVLYDGMLHPTITTTTTRTWRTASKGPNIQNWPHRDQQTTIIRSQVAASKGYKIVSFDYAGIQARNVAMESCDKKLVDVFWDHYDIHTDWMQRILKRCPRWKGGFAAINKDAALKKAARHEAKNKFVFPSFFGARAKSIAMNLGLDVNLIEHVQEQFFDEFGHVRDWQERIVADYQETGYVTGCSGFRRRAPISINELINAPIQADESIIVCNAMARCSDLGDYFQPILEVHDDLTFIFPERRVDDAIDNVVEQMLMIEFDWINVPLEVEVSIGDDWGHMEAIAKFESTRDGSFKEIK